MTVRRAAAPPFPARFRRRLAVFCAGAVGVFTAAFGIGSFLFIRNDMLERFEANALREANLQLRMAAARRDDRPERLVRVIAGEGRAAVVLVAGEAVSSHPGLGAGDVPAELAGAAGDRLRSAVTAADGRTYLVVAGPVGGSAARAYLFFDRGDVSHDISVVARSLAVAWIVVVAAACAACDRLARRALWPVRRAADAANDLASGLLQTRLPVEGKDEFAAWAWSFNRMVDELDRRIAREQRFTADVAHELRTPLGSLLTATTMLEAQREALPEQARRPAELIAQELRRLRRLVDDLLEISRLEAAGEALLTADVELRERIRQLLVSRGWDDRVRLVGPHVRVATDARRVDRVVGNLVDNAVRHGKEPVTVTLRSTDDAVVIEVEDHGEAVPPEEVSRLFEPFFKRDPSRRGPGSGLGLAIAAEQARVLGGDLSAESRPGAGMCFALVLPAPPPSSGGAAPEAGPPR